MNLEEISFNMQKDEGYEEVAVVSTSEVFKVILFNIVFNYCTRMRFIKKD